MGKRVGWRGRERKVEEGREREKESEGDRGVAKERMGEEERGKEVGRECGDH